MKLKALKTFRHDRVVHRPGDTFKTSDPLAQDLIARGYAEDAAKADAEKAAADAKTRAQAAPKD